MFERFNKQFLGRTLFLSLYLSSPFSLALSLSFFLFFRMYGLSNLNLGFPYNLGVLFASLQCVLVAWGPNAASLASVGRSVGLSVGRSVARSVVPSIAPSPFYFSGILGKAQGD